MNLCEECGACCKALRIDKKEIFWKDGDKAAGETCEKLNGGQCLIYKDRPTTCKNYECLWLQLTRLIEGCKSDWRPDNLGVIVSTYYYYEEANKFTFKIKELEAGILDFNNISQTVDEFLKVIFWAAKQQKGDGVVIIKLFGENTTHELKMGESD